MFSFFKKKEDIFKSMTDIGLVRDRNEDSSITISHPRNDNIKMLAVADGLGGHSKGDFASRFVILSLAKWFLNEDINTFKTSAIVSVKLYDYIIEINNYLYDKEYDKSKCATTLTVAIILEKYTIIANIGDSRAYALIDNQLKQLTKDDSYVWTFYENGKYTKDELRFHQYNNIVTKCIGHSMNIKPSVIRIANDSYNGLLLLTDGVSDCLSDDKINYIIHNKKDILKALINEAVYHKQNNHIPNGIEFIDIKNGKDNATAALYMKYSS